MGQHKIQILFRSLLHFISSISDSRYPAQWDIMSNPWGDTFQLATPSCVTYAQRSSWKQNCYIIECSGVLFPPASPHSRFVLNNYKANSLWGLMEGKGDFYLENLYTDFYPFTCSHTWSAALRHVCQGLQRRIDASLPSCPLEVGVIWDLLPQYVNWALIIFALLIWLFYGSNPALCFLVTLFLGQFFLLLALNEITDIEY